MRYACSRVRNCSFICAVLAMVPLTVTAKGPLHKDPETHVLQTAAPVSTETAFPTSDYGTGNWGGVRDEWKEKGFVFIPTYTSEPAANITSF